MVIIINNNMYIFTDIDDFILWNEPFYHNFCRVDFNNVIKYKLLKEELIKNINYQWRFNLNSKKEIKHLIKEINNIIQNHNFCIKDSNYI